MNTTYHHLKTLLQLLAAGMLVALVLTGCKEPEEPECVPPPPKQVVEKTPLRLPATSSSTNINRDGDFCQICVMSPKKFIRCIRTWQEGEENREDLKTRAAKVACEGAGYPYNCPPQAIMLTHCKGDEMPDAGLAATARVKQLMVTDRRELMNTEDAPQQDEPAEKGAAPAPAPPANSSGVE